MSSGLAFSKTLSADGHAMMPVNRVPTRNRSSTIGGTSLNGTRSRPETPHSSNDLANLDAGVGKSSSRSFMSRIRSNSHTNETGSHWAQPSRLASMNDNFKGRRNSILLTATDVFGLKLGRPKSALRQSPKPVILPGIIDISAARADAELEERNILRDMAAQAIGLQPYTDMQDSYDCTVTDEDDDYQIVPSQESTDLPQLTTTSRVRSGSIVAHTAATTTSFAPIPPYPSTVSSLSSFRQCEGLYPKYYSHSSLRIFALSKNWKYRYLMMSSPATFVARGQSPAVSYLHVFKSAGPEEKELERLEINEGSVVFVAENEAGGKRSVIKVGGTDVGAMKKEYMISEAGYSMWLFHIQDTADAHRWITNIKNAILGQRTVRAGLIPAYPFGIHEPHGDMDVMLSIRTQGIAASTTKAGASIGNIPINENSSFSSRSVHSLKNGGKPPGSPTSLSALKGLFTGRPRSTSRPASIDADQEKESFLTLGNSFLRSSTPDTLPAPIKSISAPQKNMEPIIDRKIFTPPHSPPWMSSTQADIILPLRPPPRKRWTAGGLLTVNTNVDDGCSGRPNHIQVPRMSMDESELESCKNGISHFGSPELRPRASSLRSVSTFTSGERRISIERSSPSTKRSSTRRWSKQSLLPSLMSPPSDPPPPIPQANAQPTFSKRISGESSRSTTSSGIYSSRRNSMPPPRPAPTSALPPAPIDLGQDEPNCDVLRPLETTTSTSKSLFRASSVQRTSRLSLIAPKPPPKSSLPPRPDDPDYKSSRRRSSSESGYLATLQSIPGSPLSPPAHDDVHPPPQGFLPPLPPPPSFPLPVPPVDQLPSTSRVTSLKRRLRILSTGSIMAVPAIGKSRLSNDRSSIDLSPSFLPPTTFSSPSTPIAEKIMPIQDDSFLQLCTPIISTQTPFIPEQPSRQDQQDLETTAVTSLSPPPRRGPKQILESDYVCPNNPISVPCEEQLDTVNHLLASPPLSPSSQNSSLYPEASETSTADGWMLAEDSSGVGTKLTSFLDSEEDDGLSSRPSSVISLGLMSF